MLYLFPVGMALSVLKDESDETAWLTSLLGASPVTKGYAGAGGGNVADFGFYVTKEALDPDTVQAIEDLEFWAPGETLGNKPFCP